METSQWSRRSIVYMIHGVLAVVTAMVVTTATMVLAMIIVQGFRVSNTQAPPSRPHSSRGGG